MVAGQEGGVQQEEGLLHNTGALGEQPVSFKGPLVGPKQPLPSSESSGGNRQSGRN